MSVGCHQYPTPASQWHLSMPTTTLTTHLALENAYLLREQLFEVVNDPTIKRQLWVHACESQDMYVCMYECMYGIRYTLCGTCAPTHMQTYVQGTR
jgi:hypothetical protein